MTATLQAPLVETRRDGTVCRIAVHVDDGWTEAVAAAHLVRRAVLDASRDGMRSAATTLDISSPACGAVLAQLRDLATTGEGTVTLRRAGATVLVHVDLAPGTDPRGAAERPTSLADPPLSTDAARHAQRRLRALLAGRAGVCGVGLARRGDGYALRVNVTDDDVDVPREIDGLPVEVRVTGPLTPHADRH